MKKATLIAFTGIDGSGKTTQAKLLVEDMKEKGIDASYIWCRWEPFLLRPFIKLWKRRRMDSYGSYNELQKNKEKLLENPFLRYVWLFLFLIDYGFQILFRLRIKLNKEGVVISDRFFYDSLIDQAINLGQRGEGFLNSLDASWMRLIFPMPDMVIYIDCPEEIAYARKDDAPDVEYLKERRELYLKLAHRYEWIKIDGTIPVNEIANQIKDKVYKVI